MKKLSRIATLLAITLFAAGSTLSAQVSIGIRIGPPPAVRVQRAPARPAADYVWVDGYWYPVGHKYTWHTGYWTRPPYAGATWVAPRHADGQFYQGYWNGPKGRTDHDHKSDRSKGRDQGRGQDQGRGRGR